MIAAVDGKRGCDAFRVGYVAGLAHFLSSLYWLLLIPVAGYPILGWVALVPTSRCSQQSGSGDFQIPNFRFQIRILGRSHTLVAGGRGGFGWRWKWFAGGCSAAFRGIRWARRNINWSRSFKSRRSTGVYGISFLVVWASLSLFSAGRMIFHRPTLRMAWQAEMPAANRGRGVECHLWFARISGQNPPAQRYASRSFNPAFRKL